MLPSSLKDSLHSMLRGKAGVRDDGCEASQSIVHPEDLASGAGGHQPDIVPDNPRWLNLTSCYRTSSRRELCVPVHVRKHLNRRRAWRETAIRISSLLESHGEHREISL